ncbi:MAG: hypothetical protein HY547_01690 [Elusimicrobia bacterium]|nr:hypothetical protein [Elusimicrobiota bacterium]
MSLCESCGERPANVFLKIQEGSQIRKLNLCEVCAQEQGVLAGGADFSSWGKLGLALEQLIESFGFPAQEGLAKSFRETGRPAQARCPNCSMTYAAFKAGGYLGCSACYGVFGASLKEIVRKIHGANIHSGVRYRGAVPRAATEPTPRQKAEFQLIQLRKNLSAALKREAYEEAIALRDKIRDLEAKVAKG